MTWCGLCALGAVAAPIAVLTAIGGYCGRTRFPRVPPVTAPPHVPLPSEWVALLGWRSRVVLYASPLLLSYVAFGSAFFLTLAFA